MAGGVGGAEEAAALDGWRVQVGQLHAGVAKAISYGIVSILLIASLQGVSLEACIWRSVATFCLYTKQWFVCFLSDLGAYFPGPAGGRCNLQSRLHGMQ